MKNTILSIVIVLAVIAGGYYLFSSPAKPDTINNVLQYATTTDETPIMEDGTLGAPTNDSALKSAQDKFAAAREKGAKLNAETQAKLDLINNPINHMITLETNYGTIVFETYDADAPNTVKNFVTLADKGFYNGLIFHRVIKGFMIQGGDPSGNGTGGPGYKFDDELNSATASYKAGYKKGVVAMANSGPNTNGSQFFIMTEDMPSARMPSLYTIFGKVVSGQDVVDKIANVQTGANDKPVSPVKMLTVTSK